MSRSILKCSNNNNEVYITLEDISAIEFKDVSNLTYNFIITITLKSGIEKQLTYTDLSEYTKTKKYLLNKFRQDMGEYLK